MAVVVLAAVEAALVLLVATPVVVAEAQVVQVLQVLFFFTIKI
jgi:hypothetical protein